MGFIKILILAVVQGLTELLPVSSSAHVIVAGRFLGWDPSTPEGTFLLVMLHTGTMFAVLLFFWRRWKAIAVETLGGGARFAQLLIVATLCTAILGLALKAVIERVFLKGMPHAEIEAIFTNLPLMAVSLFAAGLLILASGNRDRRTYFSDPLTLGNSVWIGLVQGLCLPFRGFSRSGATISTGLLLGVPKLRAEEFSFALAVILTPPVIGRELLRLVRAHSSGTSVLSASVILPGLVGMFFSFVAGLFALHWLSSWIEQGRWKLFGFYCIGFSLFVLTLYFTGH